MLKSLNDQKSIEAFQLLTRHLVLFTMAKHKPKESKINIDPDKVAENPGLLPYAHHLGSAIIKPLDKGKTKGLALSAMYEQTGTQLDQLKDQIELLVMQAQKIHDRISISEQIYQAEANFKPIISQVCYLYQRKNGVNVLSLVSPAEWNNNPPYQYKATAKLLSDHTWDIIDMPSDQMQQDNEEE